MSDPIVQQRIDHVVRDAEHRLELARRAAEIFTQHPGLEELLDTLMEMAHSSIEED